MATAVGVELDAMLVSVTADARYYLETPAGGPDWGVRLVVSLLYPKRL